MLEICKKMVVEEAINIIKGLKGVLGVEIVSEEDKKVLLGIETARNDDIIPVINQGLNECLNKEFCLVLFKTGEFRIPPRPTVILKTDHGRILGHELISDEDREKYVGRDDVYFLSTNFILFKPEKGISGGIEKELFVLPPIPFPELNNISGISDIVSGTPSTKGDEYIKNRHGYTKDPSKATVLIGFSKKKMK